MLVQKNGLTLIAATLVLLIAIVSPTYSLDVYKSAAGDYSVNFPSPPKEFIKDNQGGHLVAHIVRYDDMIYLAAHGDYTDIPNVEIEIDADIDQYVKEHKGGYVVSRSPIKIMRGDRLLPGKQFSFDSDTVVGRGIVVVDGKTAYTIVASGVKPASRMTAVSEFLGSLKFLSDAK